MARSINIELYDQQHRFVTSPHRLSAFIGGLGSGKTTAGAVKALMNSVIGPQDSGPKLGMVMAPTYPMLRDATFRTFIEVAGNTIADIQKSEMKITLINKSEILFRSADNPDRLRGPNLHWAWIDEAAMCPALTWEITLGRLRAQGRARPLWITGTPKGRNWLFTATAQLKLFRAKTRENPYLAKEFVQSLHNIYSGQFAEQELEGEFIKLEGMIYDEFDESIHVKPAPDISAFTEIIAGGDAGYTNPAVLLIIGIYPDGRLHIIDEFYARRQLNSTIGDAAVEFRETYNVELFYLDPSAAGLIGELQSRDLAVRPADHSVTEGIQTVKSFLKVQDKIPGLMIDPRCANTITEMGQYIWKIGRAHV